MLPRTPPPTDPPHATARRRAARVAPRTILGIALLAVVLAAGLYAVAPWVLPLRIYEGPLVQQADGQGLTLIWYTTRPAECALTVTVDGAERSPRVESVGTRHRVRLDGLVPSHSYEYRVLAGTRELFRARCRTNRGPDEPFHFLVYGDSGNGSREQYRLAREMERADPDFLLHTGDVVYMRGERSRYHERFFAPYAELLARVPFWPCLGNHDVSGPDPAAGYREVFELPENGPTGAPPEHHYWFDYGSARFVVIDSNLDETTLRDVVAPWLARVLTGAPVRWKIVVFHHPPYTGGKYEPALKIQHTLVPVLEAAGADVVFNGHDHMYQRTHLLRDGQIVPPGAGILYIVTAAGGADLYKPRAPARPAYIAMLENTRHSFTSVRIDGDRLKLEQVSGDGSVIDSFELRKPAASASAPTAP